MTAPTTPQLKLISIAMRNFMSYGNNVTVVRLDQPGTTFIVGKDLDNTTNGTGSNGVGKTTILNAIVYALYNRALSEDVTVDGLINNINKKNMEVTLDFSIGDMCYRIVRARKMKSGPSGNYVRFYSRLGDFEFEEKDDSSLTLAIPVVVCVYTTTLLMLGCSMIGKKVQSIRSALFQH